MNTSLLGLFAETPIHPGAGQSSGIVDLPVAREAATDYPVIVGSSLKGALSSFAVQSGMEEGKRSRVFGQADNAGALLVSDARLLLLPVRSLSSAYKWTTCPHLLERFARDFERAGGKIPMADVDVVQGKYLGLDSGTLYLEEREFEFGGGLPDGLIDGLEPLIFHKNAASRLPGQLVVINDNDFAWFARYGLAVHARNQLSENKTSENLWYEETIPADALFYAILAERHADTLEAITGLFDKRPYLQVGGNETVGMGWVAVALQTQPKSP